MTTRHSSLFRKRLERNIELKVESEKKKLFYKEITLRNGLKIIQKESSNNMVRFSFYLKNPLLFQTPLTTGVEKIVLMNIRDRIIDKTLQKLKRNDIIDVEIYSNNDFSSLSFYINKEYSNKLLKIFVDSLRVTRFNYYELKHIIKQALNELSEDLKEPSKYLDYKLNNKVFKLSPLFNSFDGNLVSLRTIKPETIIRYYKNNFTSDRVIFMISGNVDEYDYDRIDFRGLELAFDNNSEINEQINYNELISDRFNSAPSYYGRQNLNNLCYISGINRAPSFLDDDFFSYYIAMLMLNDNFRTNTPEHTKPVFATIMINKINFGKIDFFAKNNDVELVLLTFKRAIEKLRKGIGSFYYRGDEKDSIIKDYRSFNERRVVESKIIGVLSEYKKLLLSRFNLSDMDNMKKERTFVSLYFLFGEVLDHEEIAKRIDEIQDEDVIKACKKYFENISWGMVASLAVTSSLSKEFFY